MIGNAVSANGPMRLTTTTGPALLSCALMSSMVSVTTTREFPPIFSAKLRNFCSLRPQSTTDAPEAARLDEINAPIRPAAPSIQPSAIINHPFQTIHRRRRLFMPARQGAVNESHKQNEKDT